MVNTAQPIDVVAGILWRGGRYLAVERPEGKAMAGFWEFPGGKVEPGETPEDALVRELGEELAVTPLTLEFWKEKIHVYEQLTVRLFFFHIRKFNGSPTALEGQSMAWLHPRAASDTPFLEADRDIVDELAVLDGHCR